MYLLDLIEPQVKHLPTEEGLAMHLHQLETQPIT